MAGTTFSSSQRSAIDYICKLSLVYQDVMNPIVCFRMKRSVSVFMNVCDVGALYSWQIFYVVKFTTLTPFSLIILCKTLFPRVGLKISFLPTFALKSRNKIFLCSGTDGTHALGPRRSYSSSHHFYPRLVRAPSKQYESVCKSFRTGRWSENFKWYSSLPLVAVVSLFCKSV
jgi:hypothetical protein